MRKELGRSGRDRLEGLCGIDSAQAADGANAIELGSSAPGLERLEARFANLAYAPHRHDTYAIGVTLSGVQSFHYRGERRHCLPGQRHILHPDELHDGMAGGAGGFAYRILYLDPGLICSALGGAALPFVADAVADLSPTDHGLTRALARLNDPIDALEHVEIVAAVADLLALAARTSPRKSTAAPLASVTRVRDLIIADPTKRHALETLEAIADLDRWALARHFRAAFGASPTQFRTMRQLDAVRRQIRSGDPLAEAALAAGFSDQSHMTRQFKRAYGLTPARWAAALSLRG